MMKGIAVLTEQQDGPNVSMLESRIAVLEELFVRLAQAGATETILGHGFEMVSAGLTTVSDRLKDIAIQVAPLRKLGPEQPSFNREQEALLARLYKALLPPEPIDEKKNANAEEGHVVVHQRSAS
jgi:hypothetical protein